MEKIFEFLKGKKTYIIAVLVAAGAIVEIEFGFDVPDYAYIVLGAIGLGTLRAGVSDLKKHIDESQ